ncbi:MAG TPA: sigma-54 dependent transcriptional regulator [bacterium]|nr:sigma-54 dependent transcriptional regulator [bacterium]
MQRILVVDDNAAMCEVLDEALREQGYAVETTTSSEQGAEFLRRCSYNLLITDLKMPGIDGLELLRIARAENAAIEAIMITAFGTVESAVEAMKRGAADFVLKPFPVAEIELKVARLLERQRLHCENLLLREELKEHYNFAELTGHSTGMKRVYDLTRRAAPTDSPVLLRGETGTGKELVARAVHAYSRRATRPFIKVNCSAIPEGLLESELFGHEKGAFTGAIARKDGRFISADTGTIFLDEIGDMPVAMQAKMLRVLQDGEFERVGGTERIKTNVRIIAATNMNLEEAIKDGRFREDLYFRLNVIPIFIPPLRERKDDIPDLLAYCLHKFNVVCRKKVTIIDEEAKKGLVNYRWPGNVRELENIIERAVVLCNEDRISMDLIPHEILSATAGKPADIISEMKSDFSISLTDNVDAYEKALIVSALKQSSGNQLKAAKLLQVNRTTLQYKLQKHGIVAKENV